MSALAPLLASDPKALTRLKAFKDGFSTNKSGGFLREIIANQNFIEKTYITSICLQKVYDDVIIVFLTENRRFYLVILTLFL